MKGIRDSASGQSPRLLCWILVEDDEDDEDDDDDGDCEKKDVPLPHLHPNPPVSLAPRM